MPNPRLASRYAKSLVDLAVEKGLLEAIHSDMQYLRAVCKASKEFVNLLRSPIVKADKKDAILSAVIGGKVNALTDAFVKLLVKKGREGDLPEIAQAYVDQYNTIKGIHIVKLTTAVAVDEPVKQAIISKLQAEAGLANVELNAAVDEDLIGGFVLEFNDKLIDASIARDLKDVRKQFLENVYVHDIR